MAHSIPYKTYAKPRQRRCTVLSYRDHTVCIGVPCWPIA